MQLDREVRADPSVVLDIRGVLRQAIKQAGALRARLGLPSDSTDVFRLVNSEGDGISGTPRLPMPVNISSQITDFHLAPKSLRENPMEAAHLLPAASTSDQCFRMQA